MNFKKIIASAGLFALLMLSSCRFGIFNKDYPDSAKLVVKLDGQVYPEYSTSGIITINLDDNKSSYKYLLLSIEYYKNGNVVDVGGYSYHSDEIKIDVVDSTSAGVRLENINTLGAHIIQCTSNVSKKFDKAFIINIVSHISNLDILYSLQNGNEQEQISTQSYTGSEIEIKSASHYCFSISTTEDMRLPDIEITAQGDFCEIKKEDNSHFFLKIPECPDESKFNIKINVKNSSIGAVLKFFTKAQQDITLDLKDDKDDENIITLEKNSEQKSYNITLLAGELASGEITGFLSQQEDNANLKDEIKAEHKRRKFVINNYYMDFYFDAQSKYLSIITKNSTTTQDEYGQKKNIYFYIYFFDKYGQFIKRFRICISPCIEEIKFSSSKIDVKAQKTGSIEAQLLPSSNTELLWYFTKENNKNGQMPIPMKISEVDEFVSSINPRMSTGSVNISGQTYSAEQYFFAISPEYEPVFYYTTLSQAKAIYLVAKPVGQNIFNTIPFLISGDSQIILKSQQALFDKKVPTCTYTNIEDFENSFTTKNLPYGQSYPDTACGSDELGRIFYLPHNKVSTINLKIEPDLNSVSITSAKSAKDIFSSALEKGEKEGEYLIEIQPVWHKRNYDFLLNDESIKPCECIQDGVDIYGKNFYQYLGLGIVYLNVQGIKITLKIIIYDGS